MKDYTHYKYLIKLGLPIAIGQLGIIILGFADTIMVGHYSTPALAAASFVNNLFTFIMCFILGYSNGITPIIGTLFGRHNYEEVGKKFKQALVANLLYGCLTLLVAAAAYFFLEKMGQPPALLPLIKEYYLIILISMFFVLIFNTFKQFSDSITDTKMGMRIIIAGNSLNIVLNYLLIYGIGPFPELGLAGAGISTLISRFLMAVVFIFLFFHKQSYAPFRKGFYASNISTKTLLNINKCSFPLSLQMGIESGAFTFTAVMAGWIGSVQLASYQVVTTIAVIGFLLYSSLGTSLAIRVANFLGQDDWENIHKSIRAGRNMLVVVALVISAFIYLLGRPLIVLFTNDPAVIASAISLILPLIGYQITDALQICFLNALRGTGHAFSVMWISFISYLCVSIPVGYFFAFGMQWNEVGLISAFSVGLSTAALLYYLILKKVLHKQANGLKQS